MLKNTKFHHFTVVIPTRERCDTLEHALHTCVIQDYDNLDIIVSDNFSQDRTHEVVETFKDRRIRYLNTGKRVSMTDNFEFALSHVAPDGYVIFIGDDDGLLPNALQDISATIIKTGAQVLRWDLPIYYWPTLGNRFANCLFIPSLGSDLTVINSATTIQRVLSFKTPYQSLPVMYMYSAVKYEIIRKIKDLSGRFYHSMTPDVYSGFAVAGFIGSYVNSKRPYTIAGTSHHSIGASSSGYSPSSKAAQKYSNEDNLPFHSSLVVSRSLSAYIIESFLQARDHLPFYQGFKLDMKLTLFKMMQEAAPKTQEFYAEIKEAVLRIGELHDIPRVAQSAIGSNPNTSHKQLTSLDIVRSGLFVTRLFIGDICRSRFYLDCSNLAVKNIYDASILCDNILRLKDINIVDYSSVIQSSFANIRRAIISVQKLKR